MYGSVESVEGDRVKYFDWPLALSGEALRAAARGLEFESLSPDISEHVRVELENASNEARAMLQQIQAGYRRPNTEDIDPLLR